MTYYKGKIETCLPIHWFSSLTLNYIITFYPDNYVIFIILREKSRPLKSYVGSLGHRIRCTVGNLAAGNRMHTPPTSTLYFLGQRLYSFLPPFLWSISPCCQNIIIFFAPKHDTTWSVALKFGS